MRYFLILLLGVMLQAEAQSHFISPKYQPTKEAGQYAGDSRWPLGSSQLIAFQSTWAEYRIELWQQSLKGGAAMLSSNLVYNQSAGKDLPQSFFWTVQTYELQLSDAPIFFFWLRDNNSKAQQSSAYFNITIDAATSSATTTAAETKSISSTVPTSTPSSTTSTNGSPQPISTTPPGSVDQSEGRSTTGRLSTGAQAGIGVGAALGGILVIAFAGFVYFRGNRQKQQVQQQQQQEQQASFQWSEPTAFAYGSPKPTVITEQNTPRAELSG
ncbi:hypothetical protein F4802DRAFT_597292 [Xylaria palmicola]|nr:hypothetical protein F4802DRAFT_597292 [Xylaria palmicola]